MSSHAEHISLYFLRFSSGKPTFLAISLVFLKENVRYIGFTKGKHHFPYVLAGICAINLVVVLLLLVVVVAVVAAAAAAAAAAGVVVVVVVFLSIARATLHSKSVGMALLASVLRSVTMTQTDCRRYQIKPK